MRGNALLVFFQPTQGLEIRKKKRNHGSLFLLVGCSPNQESRGELKQQQTRQINRVPPPYSLQSDLIYQHHPPQWY